jgi:hypothetical protein
MAADDTDDTSKTNTHPAASGWQRLAEDYTGKSAAHPAAFKPSIAYRAMRNNLANEVTGGLAGMMEE